MRPNLTFRFRKPLPLCSAENLSRQTRIKARCVWATALGEPMLRGLYDWTLSLAARKSAEWWLAFIAFVESSVFLVPADVLYLPMALSRPERAYRYALIATVASVLGGIAGWFIGYYAYDAVARADAGDSTASLDEFEQLRSRPAPVHLLMLVTSGARPSAADQGGDDPVRRHRRQSCGCSSSRRSWRAARVSCFWPGCCAAMASRSASSSRSVWD